MTEQELDALLAQSLPERDAGEFSVVLMEAIARHESRVPRLMAWVTLGVLYGFVAAACVFGAMAAGHAVSGSQSLVIPAALVLLTLLLSFAALQSARE
jgi:hypothetical protein